MHVVCKFILTRPVVMQQPQGNSAVRLELSSSTNPVWLNERHHFVDAILRNAQRTRPAHVENRIFFKTKRVQVHDGVKLFSMLKMFSRACSHSFLFQNVLFAICLNVNAKWKEDQRPDITTGLYDWKDVTEESAVPSRWIWFFFSLPNLSKASFDGDETFS